MNVYDELAGKVAIVTGANGGMGRAIVQALAQSGVEVVASDIHLPDETESNSQNVRYLTADVSSEQSVQEMVNGALQLHGRLDMAVNAAAVEFELARLDECESGDFDRLMQVNLKGLFLCLKYQLKAMLTHKHGSIVNLASTTSIQPGQLQPAYTASKFAVAGLTKQAAVDYAADGIRINAIAPGNIDTPMLRDAVERRGIDVGRVAGLMPLKRLGQPQEIAQAALWLCSSASSFTTGHILAVEGGMLNK